MMNLAIPNKDVSEFLLYIWKIIDLPKVSINDLLYKISFEFFLLPPEKALNFIQNSIKNNLLKKDVNETIALSPNLNKKCENWQQQRKNIISKKININKKKPSYEKSVKEEKGSNFNTLLKAFLDKGTINRAATVSNSAFNLKEFDLNKGIIKAEVTGTKEDLYFIEINTKKKILTHNCHDFHTKRSEKKKFCKHLVKLFLLLKEKNEVYTSSFLKSISDNINEWEFTD